jgi:dihydrofolate reductase
LASLIYFTIASLDGYVEDDEGHYGWAAPDEEVHNFVNQLSRQYGTYLYGRRMYETMRFWETANIPEQAPFVSEFAGIWQRADKIVYSTTLEEVPTARTRLEREFDPDTVRRLKTTAPADITVGGADLAGQAMSLGIVDEVDLLVVPVIVGGGKRSFPDKVRADLELLEERRFANGVAYLRYGVRGARALVS